MRLYPKFRTVFYALLIILSGINCVRSYINLKGPLVQIVTSKTVTSNTVMNSSPKTEEEVSSLELHVDVTQSDHATQSDYWRLRFWHEFMCALSFTYLLLNPSSNKDEDDDEDGDKPLK